MKKENLRTFGHILAGIVILLHGYKAFEDHHPTGWIFVTLGTLFLLIAIFHHRLVHRFPKIDGVVFLIEAVAILATAYDHYHEGKVYLPWVFLAAMVPYLVLGILILSGKKQLGKHPGTRRV